MNTEHRTLNTESCSRSRVHARRLQWLKRGSRALFGTIVEEQMYVLIDTSASMQPQLQFIKDRIYLLLQVRLRPNGRLRHTERATGRIPVLGVGVSP